MPVRIVLLLTFLNPKIMKIPIMFMLILFASAGPGYTQDALRKSIPLLGDPAPSFTAQSTQGLIHFPDDYGRMWKILFSHPADYTSVCSSEIIELATMQKDFDKLGVKLAVVSTDDLDRHYKWEKSLETVRYFGREPVRIDFPIIEDESKSIAVSYGMLQSETDHTRDVRGVFIINPDNRVAALFFYPNNVGRNLDEIKRTVIALQTAGDNTVLTPANWKPGDDVMIPYKHGIDEADDHSEIHDPDIYAVTWYMLFRKNPVTKK